MRLYTWAENLSTLAGLAGATLAYYAGFAWLKAWRAEGNRGECGAAPRRHRQPMVEPPVDGLGGDEWCPEHETFFDSDGGECPGCREVWEQRWTISEDDQRALDDWADRLEEQARQDEWYLRMCERAGRPGDGYRPEGGGL